MVTRASRFRRIAWCARTTLTLAGSVVLAACQLSAQRAPAAVVPRNVAALPVTEVPSASGHTLALFWSGDGNWKELTEQVSNALAAHGVAVVGLSSRTWMTSGSPKSADDLEHDSESVLRWYLQQWHRDRILLIGYSRGAGFQALLYERLPSDLRARVDGIALLGLEQTASFEFHLLDLVRTVSRATDIPVKAYLDRMAGPHVVCMYGSTETDTVCPLLDPARFSVIRREGDHHFDRDYGAMADAILAAVGHH